MWSASSNGQIVGWDPVTLTPKKEVIISNPDKHSPFKLNLDCMTRVHYFGPCLFVLVLWAYACVIWIYKGKATRNSRPQAKEREDLFFFCVRYCLGLCFVSVGLPVRVFIHSFVRSFLRHSFIHSLTFLIEAFQRPVLLFCGMWMSKISSKFLHPWRTSQSALNFYFVMKGEKGYALFPWFISDNLHYFLITASGPTGEKRRENSVLVLCCWRDLLVW